MHGVELIGFDLDPAARQLAFDRDRLKAALGKLRLYRLLVDARHWSANVALEFRRASYGRRPPALKGEPRSRYERGAAPCVFLPAATRGYASRGSAAPRHGPSRPLPCRREGS